jgi:hypothetical protein
MLLAGCATGPPPGTPTVDLPRHTVGSEWEFRGRSSGGWSNVPRQPRFVFQGEREWQGRKLLAFGTFHMDDRMRMVARIRDGQVLETWEPYNNPIEFPLFVGRSWSTRFSYQSYESGRAYRDVQIWYKVEAWEDVTVPAGTFKAWGRARGAPTGPTGTPLTSSSSSS